ncbi:PucR family transcriptional regulator [Alteribacillus bidgolensis]|uniref:Transcriptional regulator, PucR family n=1 Tax=Alteribacillus bidgolensis TaxID=930129 RepID=A0A1G8NH58_9BACI|nr:PucR family transcriptional regulator [Alteribacillus bidgolensis]SDI79406.1 transcriptional regulator, PucR family [Alteribacillus bidgolensis]
MKKVEDLFILDVFQDAKILAGHSGLIRNVESMEISETPDVLHYLAKNSFLLTTGYAYKDNPRELCQLISDINELPCAGMGIKLGRFIDTLPQEVIDLADKLQFPIIQIPVSLTLGTVGHQLLGFLWDNKTEELFYAIHVHKKFTDMMMKGYTLQSLIKNLGLYLKCPVLLLSPLGEVTASSVHFQKENMKLMQAHVESLFKNSLETYQNNSAITINHPDGSETDITLNVFPVKTTHLFPYLLIIFNPEQLHYPSSKLAIEQASTVISFTLIKNEAIKQNNRVLKNNFFGSLVDGKIPLKQEIIHRGKQYNLLENAKYLSILCKVDNNSENYFQQSDEVLNQTYDFLYDYLEIAITKLGIQNIFFIKDTYFVILLQFTSPFDDTLKDSIRTSLEEFQKEAFDKLKISLSFGIGNFVNDVTSIPTTYSEAVEAWENGAELFQKEFISFYETKQIQELIRLIPKEELQKFYENTLRSLAYPKTKDEEALVKTMVVFLDNNCEIAITSKKLFVHRNTVKYRIAKCEEILNYSINTPNDSLHLRMALLMRSMFHPLGS